MPLTIVFNEYNENEDSINYYASSSPMAPDSLPEPVATSGPSETLKKEPNYGPYAVSYTIPWNSNGPAYVRVASVKNGSLSISQEKSYVTPDYSSAVLGDKIGGGVYLGKYTNHYGDQYYVIIPDFDSQYISTKNVTFDLSGTHEKYQDFYGGVGNTITIRNNMEAGNIYQREEILAPYFGGYSDWYIPAALEFGSDFEADIKPHFGLPDYRSILSSTPMNSSISYTHIGSTSSGNSGSEKYAYIRAVPVNPTAP